VRKNDNFDMPDKSLHKPWNTEPEFLSHEL